MTKHIIFREKQIYYHITGSGNALVLLHGFLETKEVWDNFVKQLQNSFTVISIDIAGHGKSETVAEVHTMELMSEIIKTILDSEKITSCVICGHSMGGYISLAFANLYPEMIKGVILFHSHASEDTEEGKENRRRTINIVKQNRQGFINQFIPALFDQKHVDKHTTAIQELQNTALQMSQESIIAALSGMRERTSQLNYLLLSTVPILFIIGKQDSRMPYNQLFAQAILPSHSEILLLEDVGHMGHIEAPEITINAVEHFALRCYLLNK